MKPWLRRTFIGLGVFVSLIAGAYYWFILESHVPSDARFPLDVAELRRLATTISGDKPSAIEVEHVASFEAPAGAIVAGDGWSMAKLPVFSYRLVYPTTSAIIDTALDKSTGAGNLAGFDDEGYARMQAGISQASLIVVTHEHMDHIGGLMVRPGVAALAPAIRLTREQLAHPEFSKPGEFPKEALAQFKPLEYDKYQPVAPGVVLVKAAGHTPGSQMVFVQTADGGEYLFIGDVAWHFRNIELTRERARLITAFLIHEDRTAVFGQLVALKQLHAAEPKLHIVPGHDGPVIDRLISSGALKSHFSVPKS